MQIETLTHKLNGLLYDVVKIADIRIKKSSAKLIMRR